jgi:hypothetical protein
MTKNISLICFLGVGDHIEYDRIAFPFGPIDIFGLSVYKTYPFYPWPSKKLIWLFLVHKSVLCTNNDEEIFIDIKTKNEESLGNFKILTVPNTEQQNQLTIIPTTKEIADSDGMLPSGDLEWQFIPIQLDGSIRKPEDYFIYATYKKKIFTIGRVIFNYQKSEPLSPEEIHAIQSDPSAPWVIRIHALCNNCNDSLKAYTGLKKDKKLENEGYVWQHDLPEKFKCSCGKIDYDLSYLRESFHAPIRNSSLNIDGGLSYTRRYSHKQILNVVNEYNSLIEKEKKENPVQKFIEENLVILSPFHGKKIFIKPSILGKYETDFVILTIAGELVFIELERPNMRLFKSDGHQTAQLTHAYGQVVDWMEEYRKHSHAILESLDIKEENVRLVKGAVVAGLSYNENLKSIQRHMMSGPYPNIDLYCLDDLSKALIQLSKDLA